MRTGLAAGALLVVAGAAAFGGYLAGRTDSGTRMDGSMAVPTPSAEGEREIAYWRAPMDPTEIYDAPGKSRMGMDLIPVYADEPEAGTTDGATVPYPAGTVVLIDAAITQNMGVRSEPVRATDFSRTIRTVGKVDYDEEALRVASTRISGWIERLHVDFVGQEVQAGQPLLEIYSPELVATQQEYLLALRNLERARGSSFATVREDAERIVASTRQRLEYWEVPVELIEALEQTGDVSKTVTLQAPASGVVIRKEAVEGAHVMAGADLFEIADLSSVWVHASFYDDELPWISDGQPVVMELSYLPGREFFGRVSYVYPYLRDKARDAHARIVFQNPDLALKPGMYVNIRIEGSVVDDAIVVPLEAVIRSGARTVAFVDHGGGRYEPREVELGEEGGENNAWVRVLSGLREGERVVTSAQFMLDSESRLQEAIRKLMQRRSATGAEYDASDADTDHENMSHDEQEPAPDHAQHDN